MPRKKERESKSEEASSHTEDAGVFTVPKKEVSVFVVPFLCMISFSPPFHIFSCIIVYLAVSRAFGDICLKEPKLVIDADPDILIHEVTENDKWLVIAS
jgi:hypothetical protein